MTLTRLNSPPSDFTPLRRPSSDHAARAREDEITGLARALSLPRPFPASAIARQARAYARTPTQPVGGRCRLLRGRLFPRTADSRQICRDLIDVPKEVREEVQDGPSLGLSYVLETVPIGVGTEVASEPNLVGNLPHLLSDVSVLREPVDLRDEVGVGRTLLEGGALKCSPRHSRGCPPRLDSETAERFRGVSDDRLRNIGEIRPRERLRVIVVGRSGRIAFADDGAATRVARPHAPVDRPASFKGVGKAPAVPEVRTRVASWASKDWHFGDAKDSPVRWRRSL